MLLAEIRPKSDCLNILSTNSKEVTVNTFNIDYINLPGVGSHPHNHFTHYKQKFSMRE